LENQEYKTVYYTIEIWLINQTTIYNEMAHQNETIYNNMWFLDKINITLNHMPIDLEKAWEPQWDYNYTINISKNGLFKLAFLLFTDSTQNYSRSKDYEYIAETKINSAYRIVYLWINVS